jgi:asparagine synthase (glutamine-hydrolysing)
MDPEGGKQPIVYEDSKYSVCANGEIYNFACFRKSMASLLPRQVQTLKCSFSCTDTFGPDFVKELNGIFGFVCVGNDGSDIIAARDHCGIKPLYIGKGKGWLHLVCF